MIGVPAALIGAGALLLVILGWARGEAGLRKSNTGWDPAPPDEDQNTEACPMEFVRQIFSKEDPEFLSRLKSPHLEKLFKRERTAVALLWIQQTSAAVRRIIRRHVQASRRSEDLEFAGEVKVFLLYVQLRVICGVLFLLIALVGPQRLRGAALYTEKITRSFGGVPREFESGTGARELSGVGPS